jgi:large subunit ribosomal protein L17
VRHRVAGRSLNADTQHRLALRRNLARALFLSDRIVTTHAKAKYVRGFAERLVTRAKKAVAARDAGRPSEFLHHLRIAARDLPDKVVLRRLLTEIAPAAKDRSGGYTRIVRDWKNQVGDNAPRAFLELVDRPATKEEAPEPEAAEKGRGKAKAPAKGKGKGAGEEAAPAKKTAKAGKAAKAGAKKGAAAADDDE